MLSTFYIRISGLLVTALLNSLHNGSSKFVISKSSFDDCFFLLPFYVCLSFVLLWMKSQIFYVDEQLVR